MQMGPNDSHVHPSPEQIFQLVKMLVMSHTALWMPDPVRSQKQRKAGLGQKSLDERL